MICWKSLRRKIHSVSRMPFHDLMLVLYAALGLSVFSIMLKVFGFNRCSGWISGIRCASGPSVADMVVWAQVRRATRLTAIAARNHFSRPNCLRSSLLLACILRRQGIPVELRIGVRLKNEALDHAALEAHAWVEWEGNVVNDRPDVAEIYLPFSNLQDAVRLP